ncbi:protein transport protein sft2 [Coccinella septempunctata]|uniref:protein transport protein sft2 n=1 Tax=Coccinella septempunctata TaxID=41139 RepID=UPI001D0736F9|nr:protein transport protein sft2 [Coccinella septempunctata]
MVDLKKDLEEYLLLQSDQKKNFKIQMPTIPKPSLPKWFKQQEPTEEGWFQETKKDCCPSLSRFQRWTFFGLCICVGGICFSLSMLYVPVLILKARKFALLFTLGSFFFVLGFFFLMGPWSYLKQMFTRERIFLTISYLGTLIATLYSALFLQSTPLTVLFAVFQIISLLWTVLSHIPGGSTGLSFFTKMFSSSVTSTLPV